MRIKYRDARKRWARWRLPGTTSIHVIGTTDVVFVVAVTVAMGVVTMVAVTMVVVTAMAGVIEGYEQIYILCSVHARRDFRNRHRHTPGLVLQIRRIAVSKNVFPTVATVVLINERKDVRLCSYDTTQPYLLGLYSIALRHGDIPRGNLLHVSWSNVSKKHSNQNENTKRDDLR